MMVEGVIMSHTTICKLGGEHLRERFCHLHAEAEIAAFIAAPVGDGEAA